MSTTLLITGASGFVGQHLVKALADNHYKFMCIQREVILNHAAHDDVTQVPQADCLIHLAGRAHVLNEANIDVYQAYANANINFLKRTLEFAHSANVKRFIFISSIKVNGEQTFNQPYSAIDDANPQDEYGKTKYEAEKMLRFMGKNAKMEVVIIRPPLIYGPGVKANFLNLIKLCQQPLPLPFGAIQNKRSMVYIENLIDFILLSATHPKAANETFLISDDEDISTTTLISVIRQAMRKSRWLLPVQSNILTLLCKLLGKPNLALRLFGNLQVDISKAKHLLGWKPPYTFKQGIEKTIQAYLETKRDDETHF